MAKKLGIQSKGTGRAAMQGGGVPPIAGAGGMAPVGGAARRDMRSGYYPSDMGMRGGPMYNKGGRVGLRDRAFRKGGTVKKAKGGRAEFKEGKSASDWEKGKFDKKTLAAMKKHDFPAGGPHQTVEGKKAALQHATKRAKARKKKK